MYTIQSPLGWLILSTSLKTTLQQIALRPTKHRQSIIEAFFHNDPRYISLAKLSIENSLNWFIKAVSIRTALYIALYVAMCLLYKLYYNLVVLFVIL